MGLHQYKNFFTTEETVISLEKQHSEWEKIFASYTTDKGLIARICRELKKLNSKRTNNLINRWKNKLNRKFIKKKYKWPINI
jgi:hypothetical protein